ncbi:MAG: LON peptidase substrate-binding domain-containing protein, partial [Arenicella sp.]
MIDTTNNEIDYSLAIPLLPLRDVVVFPNMVIPLFVGRPKSIKALENAMEAGKNIVLVAQKDAAMEEPQVDDIYDVGILASILQLLKLPDGTVKVLVEGEQRVRIGEYTQVDEFFSAKVLPISSTHTSEKESEVVIRTLMTEFESFTKLSGKVAPEVLTTLSGIDDPSRLADSIAAHLELQMEDKQEILQLEDVQARLERLLSIIEEEMDMLRVEKRIRGRVKKQMEKSQREYYLNEQ